jgi:peptidoglycan/xylan/chitin deacetylase (PgdA/CDA1 family)
VNSSSTFAERAADLDQLFARNPVIRAVNFHNTAKSQADRFDRQLEQYSRYFSSVNEYELDEYLTTGKWRKPKPGLIVSVFEGYRNGYDVFAPLLEKHGFIGWFWIITGFLNAPVPDQLNYAEHHEIDMVTHEYPDGRYALTWEEVRQLGRKHVIASHARSHTQLSLLDPVVQEQEILGSQEDFKKNLGRPVRGFVSLTGPPYGESSITDRLIQSAGYEFVFSNFQIQKIRSSPR